MIDYPRVLLIEDNQIALKLIEMIALQVGFQVTSATTGEDGLRLALQHEFNLIITDLGLPGISGDEVTRILREQEAVFHKKPTPIIGLTAHALPTIESICYVSGMNQVFNKPISIKMMEEIKHRFVSDY